MRWLANGAIDEIEEKLASLGFENNRYGLIVFPGLLISGNSSYEHRLMSIAVGNIDVNGPLNRLEDIPYAGSSDELWGTSQQLRIAIEAESRRPQSQKGGGQLGQKALGRI